MESKCEPKCECDLEPVFPGYEYFAEGWFCMRCKKPEDKARVEKWAEDVRLREDGPEPFAPTKADWDKAKTYIRLAREASDALKLTDRAYAYQAVLDLMEGIEGRR